MSLGRNYQVINLLFTLPGLYLGMLKTANMLQFGAGNSRRAWHVVPTQKVEIARVEQTGFIESTSHCVEPREKKRGRKRGTKYFNKYARNFTLSRLFDRQTAGTRFKRNVHAPSPRISN